ncbi:MAG TPA: hypothetical protein ENH06_00760 [bacterium]|nr:hypothetical protein [bacterium]
MLKFTVLCDDRESRSSYKKDFKKLGIKYEQKRLPIGDYIYGDICIERKDFEDFASSIMSGHLENQLKRMTKEFKHCFLMISNIKKKLHTKMHPHSILGAIGKYALRYKITVLMFNTDKDLYYCISRIFDEYDKEMKGGESK